MQRGDFEQYMVPCYTPMKIMPDRGLGSVVWDVDGQDFIDFAGGIAVNCLGHCHPVAVAALKQQAEKLWHLSNVMTNEPSLRLAKKLTELSFAEQVFFANSGAEANEAALKLARRYAVNKFGKEKKQIISFKKGFHGRTFFTVTVGGQETYSADFGPKPGAITHLAFNDLAALEQNMSDNVCAIMMEPIQGEGGIIPATPEFLEMVRVLCDKHNALLIFDEVQTGNGRTGRFYAYQNTGITPDILTTAKSLGGGFPIGAMLTTKEIAAHLKVGTHGSTYGGNPLACAVAEAVINEVSKKEILDGVIEREGWFREGLNKINQKFDVFSEVRGKGLLLGAVLNESWQGRAREILNAAGDEGVLILIAGPNVLRMTPSLLISQQEIKLGMLRLERALAKLI